MARFAAGLSLCLLSAMAVPSLGQTYDQVGGATDPSTSNVHVSIPIFSRPWMSASLELNSHIFISGVPGASQWNGGFTPDARLYTGIFVQAASGIEYSIAPQASQPEGGGITLYSEVNVIDPSGATHPLPASFVYDINGNHPPPASAITTDGSGLTVVTNQNPYPYEWTVYDKGGNAYSRTQASGFKGYKKVDPDGTVEVS
jgi:hypothetical protein